MNKKQNHFHNSCDQVSAHLAFISSRILALASVFKKQLLRLGKKRNEFLCSALIFRNFASQMKKRRKSNAAELTPKYPDFISERVYALSDATRWWYEYGKARVINE